MSDDEFDLLGAMLSDHAAGVTADDLEERDRPAPAPEKPRAVRETPIETTPRTWAADPNASVCGLRRGGVFELRNGGPEIDGPWLVVKLILPHGAGPKERTLVAARPEGGPPYIKIIEADFAEELEIGNAVILQKDERG